MVSGDGIGEGEGDLCPPCSDDCDAATKEDITPNEVGSKNFCTSSRSSLRLDAVEPSEKRDIVLASDWSEALKSVNVGLPFSPSLDPGKPESLHGLGLRLALERSKSTGRFCREMGDFLDGVATVYEQFGVRLAGTSQSVRPQRLPFKTCINEDFQSLYDNNNALAGGYRGLAESYRSEIVAELRKVLADTTIEVDAANSRYNEARLASMRSRQLAMVSYSKYAAADRAAEEEIQAFLQQQSIRVEDGSSSGSESAIDDRMAEALDVDLPPWEKTLNRVGSGDRTRTSILVQKLKAVETYESEYIDAVHQENDAVRVAEGMEGNALRKVQKTEEERLRFFASCVVAKVFPGQSDFENFATVTPTTAQAMDFDVTGLEKKGKDLLANIFSKQSLPYEDGMGAMDAETLGLPEEVGQLRDRVKSSFSTRENRIKISEIVTRFVADLADLSFKAASALKEKAYSGGNGSPRGPIASEGAVLGARAGDLWGRIIDTFQNEANLFAELESNIRKLTPPKLDAWLASADKDLKLEMDKDDTAWKHVCDAARTEIRYESRYKQTKQHMDKARERVSSVDQLSNTGSGDSSDGAPTKRLDASVAPATPPRAIMSRALFKGGEAMKKLQEKALVQIAKTTLNEAEQKEEKDQVALEEATATKERAARAYKNYTSVRIDKIESEDKAGWNEVKAIINSLIAFTKEFRKSRYVTLERLFSQEKGTSFHSLPADMEEWLEIVRGRILQDNMSALSAADGAGEEYALTVKSARTSNVQKLLEMNGLETTLPRMELNPIDESRSVEVITGQTLDSYTGNFDGTPHSDSDIVIQKSIRKLNRAMTAPAGAHVDEDEKLGDCDSHNRIDPENRTARGTGDVSEQSQAMKAFVKQFWSKRPEIERPPEILQIISCSYRPKETTAFLTPAVPGRLYTTREGIYFLALDNKNFVLKWEKVVSIQIEEKRFMAASNENAVAITYRSGSSKSSFTLGHLESRNSVLSHLQTLLTESGTKGTSEGFELPKGALPGQVLPSVPPDTLLKDMEVVVSKTIKNVSITALFQTIWAGESPDQPSFYESWLKEEECFDISIPAWEFAKPGSGITNAWCKEAYTQQRLVTFRFNRTTHLYIGPPVAYVKQQQYCRVEGNDKCIMAMSATFEGIPYSDTFGVEMRWVARRIGNNDVQVDVGLFVLFKKSTMLKNQIKSGTISETRNVHLRLFDAVKRACSVPGATESDVGGDVEEADETETSTPPQNGPLNKLGSMLGIESSDSSTAIMIAVAVGTLFFLGRVVVNSLFGNAGSDIQRLESRIDELQDDVRALKQSIEIMIELLKEKTS